MHPHYISTFSYPKHAPITPSPPPLLAFPSPHPLSTSSTPPLTPHHPLTPPPSFHAGIFAELDEYGVEGLVPASKLPDKLPAGTIQASYPAGTAVKVVSYQRTPAMVES